MPEPTDEELLSLFDGIYNPDSVPKSQWLPGEDRYDAAFRLTLRAVFNAGRESAAPRIDPEILEIEMGRHEPVFSLRDGHIAGCQCMDRVFYKKTEDWASHLCDAVLSALGMTKEGDNAG